MPMQAFTCVCESPRRSRGGLLLTDYSAVLATASYAIKVKELLTSTEIPTELPSFRRARAAIGPQLYTIANVIANVIDFPASTLTGKGSLGRSHICVCSGVLDHLDRLREE